MTFTRIYAPLVYTYSFPTYPFSITIIYLAFRRCGICVSYMRHVRMIFAANMIGTCGIYQTLTIHRNNLNDTQLMEEHRHDADGTDETHGKEPYLKEGSPQCSPVCILILHDSPGYIPTDKQAGKERAKGQKELRSEVVAEVEERHSHKR